MSKEDVLAMLETDLTDPGSYKSGEYLYEHTKSRAEKIIITDRVGLIDALKEWISYKKEPETMLAVRIANVMCLYELINDIYDLKNEIVTRKSMPYFYLEKINNTIDKLNSAIK